MDTVYKTFRGEVKAIEDDGVLDMFIPVSTMSVDRDGEVLEPTAFRKTIPKFMKHPVLVSSHNYHDLTKQIGEWQRLKVTENGIEGKPKYYKGEGNEEADWAYNLASKGRAAFSVGFIPTEWEDGDGEKSPRRTYKQVELLEISQVIIPSNRDAIQTIRSKSIDPVIKELCDEVESEIDIVIEEETKDAVTKPEETEDMIRIPVSEGHEEHKIRTITVSDDEGIKALYCVDCKENITYMFVKSKGWTMSKAKQWIKEHGKSVYIVEIEPEIEVKEPEEVKGKDTSQSQILDEIDYLTNLIKENGMNGDVESAFLALTKAGEIEDKSGAVLNKTNKNKLNQIKTLAQEVLDSANDMEEEKERIPECDNSVDIEILQTISGIKL